MCLAALVGSHGYIAVGTACETAGVLSAGLIVKGEGEGELRINACAEGSSSFFAVAAATVGDVEGHYYSVAFLEERDTSAGFDYHAHVFMSCFASRSLASHVEHGQSGVGDYAEWDVRTEAQSALSSCSSLEHMQI